MNSYLFWIIQHMERVKWMTGFNPTRDGSGQHGLGSLLGDQGHQRRLHGGGRPDTTLLHLLHQESNRVKYLHYTKNLIY